MTPFEKAKGFIYRNARPIEFALWKYHFENGSKDEVLAALSAYQNKDGGFAYALEPDTWNINSTPICTWYATQILDEIEFTDINHPILSGILRYLESGRDYSDNKWFRTVPTNNNYPHAIWWKCNNNTGEPDYNPTISLAGFILKFADKDSDIYSRACEIIKESVSRFISEEDVEMHMVKCYLNLLDYCEEAGKTDLFNLQFFKEKLTEKVNSAICTDTEKWRTDYVCKPSDFFSRRMSIFKSISRELIEKEVTLILETQLEDGSFPVTWQWHTDYKEFEVSKNWWKSSIIIKNMLFLKEINKL